MGFVNKQFNNIEHICSSMMTIGGKKKPTGRQNAERHILIRRTLDNK